MSGTFADIGPLAGEGSNEGKGGLCVYVLIWKRMSAVSQMLGQEFSDASMSPRFYLFFYVKPSALEGTGSAPQSIEFLITSKDGLCNIKNVWDVGDGVMHSWHGGAGMQIVEDEFGRHYFCNDGHAELRFDNLIFSVRLG